MPSSYLYAINNEGRVFGLSTSGNMWREFMYLGLEFKQLSAVPHFMWAIGGDRQVYVHVHGLDIPIRIKEETYENEVRVKCIIVTLKIFYLYKKMLANKLMMINNNQS